LTFFGILCVYTQTVDKPKDPESLDEIEGVLSQIVVACLSRDPKLVPRSALHLIDAAPPPEVENSSEEAVIDGRTSEDDFVIFTPEQAEHIAYAIKEVSHSDILSLSLSLFSKYPLIATDVSPTFLRCTYRLSMSISSQTSWWLMPTWQNLRKESSKPSTSCGHLRRQHQHQQQKRPLKETREIELV
jgi:hypothetical protein